ncbi:MAG: type I-E CRISPR-associated protein Cas7/Cse4/CasC, partial [Methylococcus sp.]
LPLRNDPMQAAMDTLGLHLAALDGMYGKTADTRHVATTRAFDAALAPTLPLDQAVEAALDALFAPAGA